MKLIISTILIICFTNLEAQIYKTNHFKIFYTKFDDKSIKEIADSLENNYTRIITNLQTQELPVVSIHFYADAAGYREGVKRWIRNLPTWAIGNAFGDSAVHMVSPNSPDVHQDYDYQEMIRNTIHEFAHCVSLHINKTIANKPRWLWESVAIYESKQTSDPQRLTYLVNQKPPTLSELNSWANPDYLYEVGYFIAEYLAESKGNAVLNSLIKNNGNIQQTLKVDDEEFTRQWFAFVKKKYGL
jgi:hypothetical protein